MSIIKDVISKSLKKAGCSAKDFEMGKCSCKIKGETGQTNFLPYENTSIICEKKIRL